MEIHPIKHRLKLFCGHPANCPPLRDRFFVHQQNLPRKSPHTRMNGPDLIAWKSDDPREKASTRRWLQRARSTVPHPAAAVRIPLARSLRLLSRPKKFAPSLPIGTNPTLRRRCVWSSAAGVVCRRAARVEARGLRLGHTALRGGGTASAPGRRKGLRGRRASRAAEGAACACGMRHAACGATHRRQDRSSMYPGVLRRIQAVRRPACLFLARICRSGRRSSSRPRWKCPAPRRPSARAGGLLQQEVPLPSLLSLLCPIWR